MDFDENLFSVEVHFVWMSELPVAGLGKTKSIPAGSQGKRRIKYESVLSDAFSGASCQRVALLLPQKKAEVLEIFVLMHQVRLCMVCTIGNP